MKNKNNYFNGIASFILSSTLLSIPHCIAAQPINVIHLDNSVSTHVINQNISDSNLPNTNDSTKTNFLDRIFVKPEVVKYAGPVIPTDGPIINRPVNPIEVVKYAGPIMPTDGPAIINQPNIPVNKYAGPEDINPIIKPINIPVAKYAGPIMPTDGPAIINQPVMRYAGPEAF